VVRVPIGLAPRGKMRFAEQCIRIVTLVFVVQLKDEKQRGKRRPFNSGTAASSAIVTIAICFPCVGKSAVSKSGPIAFLAGARGYIGAPTAV